MKPLVEIVMGTYNGERYLEEQILSLQRQTHQNWRLLVRDDGSSDGTPEILARLAAEDRRIRILHDDLGNLGFNRNFRHLLTHSSALYVMYCDQDDVWFPEKINTTLEWMLKREQGHAAVPILVHSDSIPADESLKPLSTHFIGARGARRGIEAMLFSNPAQGATCMLNASLRLLALRQASFLLPFDYHTALIAEATGIRAYIAQPLMLYRQHPRNIIGIGGSKPGAQNPHRKTLSSTLKLGIDAAKPVAETIGAVKDHWHPDVARALARHNALICPRWSWTKLGVALFNRYTFYRRLDRLNLLLYAVGLPNLD
jgi:rhamnosyltransferase